LENFKEALAIQRLQVGRELERSPEVWALAQVAQIRGRTSHAYFSEASADPSTAAESYRVGWDEKGTVQQLLARRHLAALARRPWPGGTSRPRSSSSSIGSPRFSASWACC